MPDSARESYLTTEVLTATPQKTQLLLIEAALRSSQRAGQQWAAKQDEAALQSLLHAQAVDQRVDVRRGQRSRRPR